MVMAGMLQALALTQYDPHPRAGQHACGRQAESLLDTKAERL